MLSPGTLPGHPNDYVFFVPTKTCLDGDSTGPTGDTSGLVVLNGSSGPAADGRWTLDFAAEYGAYDETIDGGAVKGHGQVFLSPMNRTSCPAAAAASQDPTFDLNYANGGSILVDPTAKPGSLLLVYEGTNRCVGSTGAQDDKFYSTLGIATSTDSGKTWPAYRTNAVPLPQQSATAGPNAALGATGSDTCAGNDCASTPPASFGRYAVLGAPVSLSRLVAAGQPLATKSIGDSEPSAFVDDAAIGGDVYLFTLQNSSAGPYAYPSAAGDGEITIARAKLGGSGKLSFTKWYAGSFAAAAVSVTGTACGPGSTATTTCMMTNAGLGDEGGGLESAIFPQAQPSATATTTCQSSDQTQLGPQLSYVEATHEYLLTFICSSPVDPAAPSASPPAGSTRGAAWFYATLDATRYDLSRQDKWSAPQEIAGSWAWLTSNMSPGGGCPPKGCAACVWDGWYATFMSLGAKTGHLGTDGFAFAMRGCQDTGAGSPREYVSRTFTMRVAPR